MITTFVQALMGAEADAVCGADYGVRNDERFSASMPAPNMPIR